MFPHVPPPASGGVVAGNKVKNGGRFIHGSWAEPQRAVINGGPAGTRRRAEVVASYKGRVYAKKMR